MQIVFQTDGGVAYIPGLSRPLALDTSEIGSEEAARLEHLVHAARFFELSPQSEPVPSSAAPAGADQHSYTITVSDGALSHTVRRVEPIADPRFKALVDYLRPMQRSWRF